MPVSQTSFEGETNGSIVKCQLFSQASHGSLIEVATLIPKRFNKIYNLLISTISFEDLNYWMQHSS